MLFVIRYSYQYQYSFIPLYSAHCTFISIHRLHNNLHISFTNKWFATYTRTPLRLIDFNADILLNDLGNFNNLINLRHPISSVALNSCWNLMKRNGDRSSKSNYLYNIGLSSLHWNRFRQLVPTLTKLLPIASYTMIHKRETISQIFSWRQLNSDQIYF